jgi:NADPH-dependent ferric siderophore reductase
MIMTATHSLPMILDEVEVVAVERLSPTYVRVELGAPVLADFGVDGPLYDQRVKLIFPSESGALPSFESADEAWFATWRGMPASERGHMRTYTVREIRGAGAHTRLVVDFVLHHLDEGATGPGSAWASRASVGDRLVLVAPRKGHPFGGIEFAPGGARLLLMAGDETAVPAVCSILEDLPAGARGIAFLEVPDPVDAQEVDHPAGVEVIWLPRRGEPLGARLHAAVLDYLGAGCRKLVVPEEVDPDLWETPVYSSSGDGVGLMSSGDQRRDADLYAWIAGEAGVVTALRRHLVKELGMDRRQVAFMGYWRRGVAMRS